MQSKIPMPPLPFGALAWQILLNEFPAETIRLLSRHVSDVYCDGLRKQVYKISGAVTSDMQIS
jgi:hypothetical protein